MATEISNLWALLNCSTTFQEEMSKISEFLVKSVLNEFISFLLKIIEESSKEDKHLERERREIE